MGNGASGGGVDINAEHLLETLGPKQAAFVKQFVNGEGLVPGGRVKKLRETIAKAQVEADEWWKNLDANHLGVGAEEAGKRPPSTKEEKMRAMFEWADKDWDGFLNRAEANKLQAVNNPNNLIDEAMWNTLAGQLGYDPQKGFDFETVGACFAGGGGVWRSCGVTCCCCFCFCFCFCFCCCCCCCCWSC